ncbi:MAG: DISARM system helicase DrmA [Thiobacillus sp.]
MADQARLTELREQLFDAVGRDLLGPADGIDEEVPTRPDIRARYLVGQLVPMGSELDPSEFDELGRVGDEVREDGDTDSDTPQSQSLMPSSIGLTFSVEGSAKAIQVLTRWGHYDRIKSETELTDAGGGKSVWKRTHVEPASIRLELVDGPMKAVRLWSMEDEGETVSTGGAVFLEGRIRKHEGSWVVTLFLVNRDASADEEERPEKDPRRWLFQAEIGVRGADGDAVFIKHGISRSEDTEREILRMLHRNEVEFAVGHGVATHAVLADGGRDRATSLQTRWIPWYDVAQTETPNDEDWPGLAELELDMQKLAELPDEELFSTLRVLTREYGLWIQKQTARVQGGELAGHEQAAKSVLGKCAYALRRLEAGIEKLTEDADALRAFRFANQAMAMQRRRSVYALKRRRAEEVELDGIDAPKWRAFQLAFLLLNVPSLADPSIKERTDPRDAIADLIWFPTGGGKTEAYLGAAAFAMGMRRLQGVVGGYDGRFGVAVIMRYTLRLLTVQQFQRASTLICAMEVMRRADPKTWGEEPFRIGLWVGGASTPNSTEDSEKAIREEKGQGFSRGGGSPYQLTNCPWCGSKISPEFSDYRVDRDLQRTLITCSDKLGECEFTAKQSDGEGIPAVVVDEEIYRMLPSLLIGTVDKFAQMPWNGTVQTLFGRVNGHCARHGFIHPDAKIDCSGNHNASKHGRPATRRVPIDRLRPPDLIIQDELHLISGPLGTMVGLYETAVDRLCEWQYRGVTVRPKVIAATATVRRAKQQVHGLFLRTVEVFPPRGLDIEDNFFSVMRPVTPEKPGRRYAGICALGKSRPATLIRVYTAFLTAAQKIYNDNGRDADTWMTLLGYFNSLRELGGMRRLVDDDVTTRAFRIDHDEATARPEMASRKVGGVEELTSRKASKDIPKLLDRLEISFDPEEAAARAAARKAGERNVGPSPYDVMLATNMVSVGVDVGRLGLMVVAGQPKNTAEYIQATSRVGRQTPGLVCTVLNWARPRDLSHYERFEHYHATFYQQVEALSVTPFAPRAIDRGLTGVAISMLRMQEPSLNPNKGAGDFSLAEPYASDVVNQLANRAWEITDKPEARDYVAAQLRVRFDEWARETQVAGRVLGYKKRKNAKDAGALAPLLRHPDAEEWTRFTVMNSLREVEPSVGLVLDDVVSGSGGPDWESSLEEGTNDEA